MFLPTPEARKIIPPISTIAAACWRLCEASSGETSGAKYGAERTGQL
jgi:hypothetical protein